MSKSVGTWRLMVTSEFCASHQLREYQGKCENLHGHNFSVGVELEGNRLDPRTGILMDFKVLKGHLNGILKGMDHKHLNELEPFQEQNPSSELLAQYIFQRLKEQLADSGVRLCSVSVSEKESSKAVYSEG
ncbi:MAG: 6-carboxytetrahydropterin synthase QueD [Desulfovibrionales bacterium]